MKAVVLEDFAAGYTCFGHLKGEVEIDHPEDILDLADKFDKAPVFVAGFD